MNVVSVMSSEGTIYSFVEGLSLPSMLQEEENPYLIKGEEAMLRWKATTVETQ